MLADIANIQEYVEKIICVKILKEKVVKKFSKVLFFPNLMLKYI